MRAVFIGAGELTSLTARELLDKENEVVIVEKEKSRIDELSGELDAGFIHGDGSKPTILREADPEATDFLFCLTGNDQHNIITSLVGRSLGYKRVVTRIEDPSFEHICIELGLTDVIVPAYTMARYLSDLCAGQNPLETSAVIKGEARIFSFVVHPQDEGKVEALGLPERSRVAFMYRNEKLMLPDPDTQLKRGDEIVIIAHSDVLSELEERWTPRAKDVSGEQRPDAETSR